VPFPRLHVFPVGIARLTPRGNQRYCAIILLELSKYAALRTWWLLVAGLATASTSVATVIYGKVPMKEIEGQVRTVQDENSTYFVEWIPNSVPVACVVSHRVYLKIAVRTLGNMTVILGLFHRVSEQFTITFKRAFFTAHPGRHR
jgi:Tubulin C-terminal domain